MADHAASASKFADALNRAWRTLYVAIGLDALALIGVGLTDLLTDANIDVTSPAFWGVVGVLVLKSLLTSIASFLLRLKVTPRPNATAHAVGLTLPESREITVHIDSTVDPAAVAAAMAERRNTTLRDIQ